ncbi:MAG TPA: hypothetical protein H9871_06630, partial [Candidatus Nesterenkonia stercoripullorum]|nr:hypothetical protein [Candidatus Nesterenkonia stercoripullorum]
HFAFGMLTVEMTSDISTADSAVRYRTGGRLSSRENPASSTHPPLTPEVLTEDMGCCADESGATPVSRSAPAAEK